MKKSIIIFVTMVALSVGMVAYGWNFVNGQVGEARLTEETVIGNRDAADGLTAGFRADSMDSLHWTNSFDFSTDKTESSFKRGEMTKTADPVIYETIRFTGWSTVPYATALKYDWLEGIQDKKVQSFYDKIQQKVLKDGAEQEGRIRLKDYLDFYPVSFRFQFGTKTYNSNNALTGLKVYDGRNMLSSEDGPLSYYDEVDLYVNLNKMFKIPVIGNEYQEYRVSQIEEYDDKKSLGYNTEIKKPLDKGGDYYEFDPIITLQEENIKDGRKWIHPDRSDSLSYEADTENHGRAASDYGLKNRVLFIVNNKTAKGASVDVSQIRDGYGVYELPIDAKATATIRRGKRSNTVPDPKPLSDKLAMVYPLDEKAEYVEMSLSDDHRYLAVFSVKDGNYYAELVDADTWKSKEIVEMFPASEEMAYAWGEDGSLAVTNHEGYVTVFARMDDDDKPYKILYSGKVQSGFDKAFFDTEMVGRDHSYAKYKYCIDRGLAVTTKDGKAALVQNMLVGNPEYKIRNAALVCAIIDKSGVIYRGRLKSNIVDLDYDMSEGEIQMIREFFDGKGEGRSDSDVLKNLIEPVRNENWSKWKTPAGQ